MVPLLSAPLRLHTGVAAALQYFMSGMAVARSTFAMLEPYGEWEYVSSGTNVVVTGFPSGKPPGGLRSGSPFGPTPGR